MPQGHNPTDNRSRNSCTLGSRNTTRLWWQITFSLASSAYPPPTAMSWRINGPGPTTIIFSGVSCGWPCGGSRSGIRAGFSIWATPGPRQLILSLECFAISTRRPEPPPRGYLTPNPVFPPKFSLCT